MKAQNNGGGHHLVVLVMLTMFAMLLAWNFSDVKRYLRIKMM